MCRVTGPGLSSPCTDHQIDPPLPLEIVVGHVSPVTLENKREVSYHTTSVTKVAVVALGQVGRPGAPASPPRSMVLAGLRAAPPARLFSHSRAGLGLACRSSASFTGGSRGLLPTVTGVHVYTSTFSAHVSSIQQGHFLCRLTRGPKR